LQRRDVVYHPHTAAIGGYDQHIVPRMDFQVPDRSVGQSAAQAVPALTVVGAHVYPVVGAHVQKAFFLGSFADDVGWPARQVGTDVDPGLAKIIRLEDVRSEIVVMSSNQGDVDSTRFESGSLEAPDMLVVGKSGGNFRPGSPAVPGDMEAAVVGSGVDYPELQR